MRILFQNANHLLDGIGLLADDLKLELTDGNADVTVFVETSVEDCLCVSLQNDHATITYGGGKARFFRGLATLVGWINDGIREKTECLTPIFSFDGGMMDVSRNAVMNPPYRP